MATKEKWIFSQMKNDVDAIVLMNAVDPNVDNAFFYATGIPNGLFEGCLAIIGPKKTEVLSSELEELSSREAGVKTSTFKTDEDRMKLLQGRLKGMKKVGVNSENLTLGNYRLIRKAARGAKMVDISRDLDAARMIKQPDEAENIRKACRIAADAGKKIPEFTKAGQTETGAAARLNYEMMALGARAPSFVTAVAFGEKSAEPHYMPLQRTLKRGQFALFDYGAVHSRYVSDITRTFVCGRPSTRQKEMYEVVLDAQLAAIDAIRPGVDGRDVDAAARRIIEKSRYKGRFIHSTGHGLGVSVHDPGSLSPRRKMTLREGMVLTVEPGVYVKGFGGVRIEDDIMVTRKGCEILTPLTKEFLTL